MQQKTIYTCNKKRLELPQLPKMDEPTGSQSPRPPDTNSWNLKPRITLKISKLQKLQVIPTLLSLDVISSECQIWYNMIWFYIYDIQYKYDVL